MLQPWILREAQVSDLPEVLRLVNQTFSIQRQLTFYNWLRRNPLGPPVAVVAECRRTNRLLGHFSLIPRQLSYFGESHKVGLPFDVLVVPEMRGTGIYTDLGHGAFELGRASGLVAACTPPGNLALPGMVRRLGLRSIGRLRLYHRRLGVTKQLEPFLGKAAGWVSALHRLPSGWRRSAAPTSVPADQDRLWDRARARVAIGYCKDRATLEWRHEAADFFLLREGEETLAVATLKWAGRNNAFITELVEAEPGHGHGRRLVSALVAHCARVGAENLFFFGSEGGSFEEALKGFHHIAERDRWMGGVIFADSPLEPDFFQKRHWTMTAGDTDLV